MVFYRNVKFIVNYQCSLGDKIVVDTEQDFDKLRPIGFISKDEAYRLGGNLEDWATKYADNFAEQYAKKRCPGPSPTPTATDWEATVYDYSETPEVIEVPPKKKIPTADIVAERQRLVRLKERYRKALEAIEREIGKLEEEYEF